MHNMHIMHIITRAAQRTTDHVRLSTVDERQQRGSDGGERAPSADPGNRRRGVRG